MRATWEGEIVGVSILKTPRSVLEHVRSCSGVWWSIMGPKQEIWFVCYHAGRWIFSTPQHGRAMCSWNEAYTLLESLNAKSFEIRLEPNLHEPIKRPGFGLVLLLIFLGAALSVFWLLRALGIIS